MKKPVPFWFILLVHLLNAGVLAVGSWLLGYGLVILYAGMDLWHTVSFFGGCIIISEVIDTWLTAGRLTNEWIRNHAMDLLVARFILYKHGL